MKPTRAGKTVDERRTELLAVARAAAQRARIEAILAIRVTAEWPAEASARAAYAAGLEAYRRQWFKLVKDLEIK